MRRFPTRTRNFWRGLAFAIAVAAQTVAASPSGSVLPLDGTTWLLAADAKNVGKAEHWFDRPSPEAKPARVPGLMQETLGEYHGVAWYWRTLEFPRHPHPGGRYLLRFWSIDYYIEVWVNGRRVGEHEGVDAMVEFDITEPVKAGAENLVAVRLINPGNKPIEGFAIRESPGRNKFDPWSPGASYNGGGIVDSVELLLAPPVRIESLYFKPDWRSGVIEAEVNVRNTLGKPASGNLALSVAPASEGETLELSEAPAEFSPGDTLLKTHVQVRDFRLWNLDTPTLYRVTARVCSAGGSAVDEKSARCGFRDFRFADGYFRLNGKRVFLKSAHFGGDVPMTGMVATDPSMLRKDFLSLKLMGFNMARCISGLARRHVMDLADEIGLMVYDECYAAWCVAPSPHSASRWNQSTAGMIRRDRNHPSVVIWGLLNETLDGPVFAHAMDSLEFVKQLDDTRVVMLNSGRFDGMLDESPDSARKILPQAWVRGRGLQTPFVACNKTGADIVHDGTVFPADQLALHVGPSGEPAVLRFVARADGEYQVSARFQGIAGPPANGPVATGAAQFIARGQTLFSDKINCDGRPNETSYAGRVTLRKGDTIEAVCSSGNATFNSDTIRVDLAITDPAGVVHDAAKDWTITNKSPQGVWAYGSLPAGPTNAAAGFIQFQQAFDGIRRNVGSLSNPGSRVWEDVLADKHPYQPCPHTAEVIRTLRTIGGGGRPLFISEYGFGSANHLLHLSGHYAQADVGYAFDRKLLDESLRKFSADWERWKLAEIFGNMENYFRQCVAMEAGGRLLGTSAIRANTNVVAHSLTACHDTVMAAEGVITSFREPKPGVFDAMWDAWSPLRFCVFAEPVQAFRGNPVRIEVVLVNEDVLKPGKYPVRLQVLGPNGYRALDTSITIAIPERLARPEPPFATPVFSQDVKIDGPAGSYKVFAFFEERAAAEGGEYTFWVDDPATMPKVNSTVTLWGQDDGLARWLEAKRIKTQSFDAGRSSAGELILVGNAASEDFGVLGQRVDAGATAILLCPAVFEKADSLTRLLPPGQKMSIITGQDWLYQNNDWARNHPIFQGLPTGLLDYQFYREILGDKFFGGETAAHEAVAGMINTGLGYNSGLTVAVYRRGMGRLVFNSLRVRENLAPGEFHPVAERLLQNMLSFAER